MHEISTEMCGLLDQQSEFLNSQCALSAMSPEEVEQYADRYDRLWQLSKQLNEFDCRAKKRTQPKKNTGCPMSDVWGRARGKVQAKYRPTPYQPAS